MARRDVPPRTGGSGNAESQAERDRVRGEYLEDLRQRAPQLYSALEDAGDWDSVTDRFRRSFEDAQRQKLIGKDVKDPDALLRLFQADRQEQVNVGQVGKGHQKDLGRGKTSPKNPDPKPKPVTTKASEPKPTPEPKRDAGPSEHLSARELTMERIRAIDTALADEIEAIVEARRAGGDDADQRMTQTLNTLRREGKVGLSGAALHGVFRSFIRLEAERRKGRPSSSAPTPKSTPDPKSGGPAPIPVIVPVPGSQPEPASTPAKPASPGAPIPPSGPVPPENPPVSGPESDARWAQIEGNLQALSDDLNAKREAYVKDPSLRNKLEHQTALSAFNAEAVAVSQRAVMAGEFARPEKPGEKQSDAIGEKMLVESIVRANAISEQLKIETLQQEQEEARLKGRNFLLRGLSWVRESTTANETANNWVKKKLLQYHDLPWKKKIIVGLALAGPSIATGAMMAIPSGVTALGFGTAIAGWGAFKLGMRTGVTRVKYEREADKKGEQYKVQDEARVQSVTEGGSIAEADALLAKMDTLRDESLRIADKRTKEQSKKTMNLKAAGWNLGFAGLGAELVHLYHTGELGEMKDWAVGQAEKFAPGVVGATRELWDDAGNALSGAKEMWKSFFEDASPAGAVTPHRPLPPDTLPPEVADTPPHGSALEHPALPHPATVLAGTPGAFAHPVDTAPAVGPPAETPVIGARAETPAVDGAKIMPAVEDVAPAHTPIPTEHVSGRTHLDYNTKPFDKNEQRLWWGGAKGHTGVVMEGGTVKGYEFDVSRMKGISSHDHLKLNPQEVIKDGKMVVLLTADDASNPIPVEVSSDGKIFIPADSPAAKLFAIDPKTHGAVYNGKFAEAATQLKSDGKWAIFATHVGKGTEGLPMVEVVAPSPGGVGTVIPTGSETTISTPINGNGGLVTPEDIMQSDTLAPTPAGGPTQLDLRPTGPEPISTPAGEPIPGEAEAYAESLGDQPPTPAGDLTQLDLRPVEAIPTPTGDVTGARLVTPGIEDLANEGYRMVSPQYTYPSGNSAMFNGVPVNPEIIPAPAGDLTQLDLRPTGPEPISTPAGEPIPGEAEAYAESLVSPEGFVLAPEGGATAPVDVIPGAPNPDEAGSGGSDLRPDALPVELGTSPQESISTIPSAGEVEAGLKFASGPAETGGLLAAAVFARMHRRLNRRRLSQTSAWSELSKGARRRPDRMRRVTFGKIEKQGLRIANVRLPEMEKRLSTGIIGEIERVCTNFGHPINQDDLRKMSALRIVTGRELNDQETTAHYLILSAREKYRKELVDAGIISQGEAERSSKPREGENIVDYLDRLQRMKMLAVRYVKEGTPAQQGAEAEAA